jgi:hypothetical protein
MAGQQIKDLLSQGGSATRRYRREFVLHDRFRRSVTLAAGPGERVATRRGGLP